MSGRQWVADWWLSCYICFRQDWIDGPRYKQRYETAKKQGWRLRDNMWICQDCIKKI